MNNNTHPCANKCSEFKEDGQCFYCLINETPNQGVYAIKRINLRQDDTPMGTRTVEFKKGDCIVFDSVYRISAVLKIAVIADNKGYVVLEIKNKRYIADLSEIRLATNVEIKAGHRDELQKENDALVHVIKSRDIQLENEKHEYDELMNKLVDSGMKNAELQKRVDLTLQLVNEMKGKRYPFSAYADQLEQALKGESNG